MLQDFAHLKSLVGRHLTVLIGCFMFAPRRRRGRSLETCRCGPRLARWKTEIYGVPPRPIDRDYRCQPGNVEFLPTLCAWPAKLYHSSPHHEGREGHEASDVIIFISYSSRPPSKISCRSCFARPLQQVPISVIPAKAGIQANSTVTKPGFPRARE